MGALGAIFLNVLGPVFALVIIGYLAGPRLGLQSRTLSRLAYYVLAPAFVFGLISNAQISGALAARMIGFVIALQLCCAVLGFGVARLLGRSRTVAAAYLLIVTFANVGNFGLAIVHFALGDTAILPATIYFVAISTSSFAICVAAANWVRGGGLAATVAVVKTPAVVCLVPALAFNLLHLPVPTIVGRSVDLLSGAMIPAMLLGLGIQFGENGFPRLSSDMLIASGLRLIAAPALAVVLVLPFGLTGIERGAGIIQASTPAAVFAAIIAVEHDLLPDFVTATVLLSTIISVVTIGVVLYLL
jgi:predicted permease